MPAFNLELTTGEANIMSVMVPTIQVKEGDKTNLYPYSFAAVSAELDDEPLLYR